MGEVELTTNTENDGENETMDVDGSKEENTPISGTKDKTGDSQDEILHSLSAPAANSQHDHGHEGGSNNNNNNNNNGSSNGNDNQDVNNSNYNDYDYDRDFLNDDYEDDDEEYYQESDYSAEYENMSDANCCTRIYYTIANYVREMQWYCSRSHNFNTNAGRLLERDNAFDQCSGLLHIAQKADQKTQSEILSLYAGDWFHVVLSWPTWQLLLVMFFIYTCNLLLFAGFYVAVDRPGSFCGIAATEDEGVSFQTAFAFSLITSSTIGYGFPKSSDPFFQDCPSLVVVVYFQVIVSLLINALVVGLVLQRIGRADSRSHQVVFSNKACIRCIHGKFYFMFQVYDLDRRHPVVEAHVRCYSALHETDGLNSVHFQTRYMRLQNPNDELGGVLFLSVPCVVVHCIDQWSPLMPPKESRKTWQNVNDDFVHSAANRYVFPTLILREADCATGSRDGAHCPICGESFPTDQHLLRHIRYMQWEEKLNGGEPILNKALLMRQFSSYETTGEESDLRYLPDGARQALNEQQSKIPMQQQQQKEDSMSEININDSSSSMGRSASDVPRTTTDPALKGHKSRLGRQHSSHHHDDHHHIRTKSLKSGAPTRVNKMLKYYADLSLPISHLDVDMNLLPTEHQIVPEREDRKRRHTTDVFSLFEEIEKQSSRNRRKSQDPSSGDASGAGASKLPSNQQQSSGEALPATSSMPSLPSSGMFSPPSPKSSKRNYSSPGVDEDDPIRRSRSYKQKTRPVNEFRRALEDHVEQSGIEIIVLVEGIEARSSNTFQARHSYSAEDIEFDKFFAPCMRVAKDGHAEVNLNSFHQLVPVPSFVSEAITQSHC